MRKVNVKKNRELVGAGGLEPLVSQLPCFIDGRFTVGWGDQRPVALLGFEPKRA